MPSMPGSGTWEQEIVLLKKHIAELTRKKPSQLPGCLLTKTANQSIPTNENTRITNWVVDFNDAPAGTAMADPATGIVTIREDGVYDYEFKGTFGAGVAPVGQRIMYITRTNPTPSTTGTMAAKVEDPVENSNVGYPMLVRGRRRFTAGQTLHPVVWHSQGHLVDFRGDNLLAGPLHWFVQKVRS